nr:hypothetical protein [Streptomyces sp. CB01373]
MVGVRLVPLLALGVLAHPMGEQGADGGLVQVDDAVLAALGLRLAERHSEVPGGAVRARDRRLLVLLPAGLLYDLLPDHDDPAGEVDVIPAQADGLAAAQARTGDHLEQPAETIVERLLTISGEDAVTVDRKHKEPWSGRLPARFMLLSNEPPAFRDSSGAIASRLLILTMTISNLGREDTTLERDLAREMPGILNWALDGTRRSGADRRRGRWHSRPAHPGRHRG